VKVASSTDKGTVRKENQDAVAIEIFDREGIPMSERTLKREIAAVFAVVCDGMGGARSGGKAAQIASIAIKDVIAESYKPELSGEDIQKLILRSIKEANSMVYSQSQQNTEDRGMGTTCSLIVADSEALHIGQVGDSRVYVLENDSLKQITTDHSYVRLLYDAGEIEDYEMDIHPQRNLLTRALGVAPEVEVDYISYPLKPKSKILICSDGLHGYCDKKEIENTMIIYDGPTELSECLIHMANSNGGGDNITVVIAMN
jgi:protein phosphatase